MLRKRRKKKRSKIYIYEVCFKKNFRKIKKRKKERMIHKIECNDLQLIRERENINTQEND